VCRGIQELYFGQNCVTLAEGQPDVDSWILFDNYSSRFFGDDAGRIPSILIRDQAFSS
jgi:hypothetical protein